MYIKYNELKDVILIDVRTKEEYDMYSFCDVNIPIVNEQQRSIFKQCYPSAFFVILYYAFKRKSFLEKEILKVYKNTNKQLIFACSKGRLRSPFIFLYSKYILKIDCKVLWLGVKGNAMNLSY